MGRLLMLAVIVIQAGLLFFTPRYDWSYFVRVHEVALENQGKSFCYEVHDSHHYSDGWYCLTYWGKAKGGVPSVYSQEDEYVSQQLPSKTIYR